MALNYSHYALCAYYMKQCRHMSNAACWKAFPSPGELARQAGEGGPELEKLSEALRGGAALPGADGMVCAFDPDFPRLNPAVPRGQRPFLLFYRGDIALLRDLNRNVAVIGGVDVDETVLERERRIVSLLVKEGLTVVSGLARGCDAQAHRVCLEAAEEGGRTIAILPSQLDRIYPAQHRGLAEEIVGGGGLLLTEYAGEAGDRYQAVRRFTDRDRLQAMFSKAVILIASHRRGEGDSGSRYAMESAKKYGVGRYVMFDRAQDGGKPIFGLNQDLLAQDPGVRVLLPSSLKELAARKDPDLSPGTGEQLTLGI